MNSSLLSSSSCPPSFRHLPAAFCLLSHQGHPTLAHRFKRWGGRQNVIAKVPPGTTDVLGGISTSRMAWDHDRRVSSPDKDETLLGRRRGNSPPRRGRIAKHRVAQRTLCPGHTTRPCSPKGMRRESVPIMVEGFPSDFLDDPCAIRTLASLRDQHATVADAG
jgi:hypothetical protein